jgi:hypothetical protein
MAAIAPGPLRTRIRFGRDLNPGATECAGITQLVRSDLVEPHPVDAPYLPDDALIFPDGEAYVFVVRNDHISVAKMILGGDDGR